MSSRFDFLPTPLAGLTVIRRRPYEDARGSFARLFCAEEFREIGLSKPIAQVNHSVTRQKGALRGLHFQHAPHAETKIVSCLKGKVFDVAVDLRPDSPTFLHWHGEVVSAGNRQALFIPEGFAHGFQTLEEDSELLYFHTDYYVPAAEGALNVADPRLGIAWPLPITELSERDRAHPFIGPEFAGVSL
jgi:dTDP-4-dehydrorhamnose 3,5-epimerase